MIKPLVVAALAAVSLLSLPARATDVGVSVQISQPGVYGRIDIGQYPQPVLMMQQPLIVQQPAYVQVRPQPVYMWVPPGHQKHWAKHCGRYNACGVPVYFVQDRWYRQHVMVGRGGDRGGYGGGDRDDWRDGGRGRDDDGPGRGHGNGHGHGRGHGRD